MILPITEFADERLDIYARLTEAQIMHPQKGEGLFIAESPVVIERALDAGYEPVSLLMDEHHVEGQAAGIIARCGDIPVFTAELEVLTQLTGFHLTRGILCAMKRQPLPDISSVCSGARRIAILEDTMNPTNLGAIFRSAAALGFDAVLLSPGCTDPLYRRSVRVSMGTVFQIPWTILEEWPAPQLMHDMGFVTAAMALSDNSVSVEDPCLQVERLALVFGTEGDGLRENTIAKCDYTVKIPMYHGVDSLNVAAASAVAFWELRYGRGKG